MFLLLAGGNELSDGAREVFDTTLFSLLWLGVKKGRKLRLSCEAVHIMSWRDTERHDQHSLFWSKVM
jgi:hypothetical protein